MNSAQALLVLALHYGHFSELALRNILQIIAMHEKLAVLPKMHLPSMSSDVICCLCMSLPKDRRSRAAARAEPLKEARLTLERLMTSFGHVLFLPVLSIQFKAILIYCIVHQCSLLHYVDYVCFCIIIYCISVL